MKRNKMNDKKKDLFIKALMLLFATILLSNSLFAQTEDKWGFRDNNKDKWTFDNYTRGSGFVIRPELYSGLFATIGCQFNHYVQLSGGVGVGLDQYGGTAATMGIRIYTSDIAWAAMFDYHIGFASIEGIDLMRHTFICGASYKDFDFGAGLIYLTNENDSGIGLSITAGYNIRCYKHRRC